MFGAVSPKILVQSKEPISTELSSIINFSIGEPAAKMHGMALMNVLAVEQKICGFLTDHIKNHWVIIIRSLFTHIIITLLRIRLVLHTRPKQDAIILNNMYNTELNN